MGNLFAHPSQLLSTTRGRLLQGVGICAAIGVPNVANIWMQVDALSSLRVYIAKDLRPPAARQTALKALQEVQRRFPKGVPLLDPREDMSISDSALRKAQRRLEALEGLMRGHPLAESGSLLARLRQYQQKQVGTTSSQTCL